MREHGVLLWETRLKTLNPLLSLPQASVAVSECQDSPKYYHECWPRVRETHCMFKYTLAGEGRFRNAQGEHRVTQGSGFLVKISDPEAAYYYPTNGTEPWVFVYLLFDGADALVAELVRRYGAIYRLPEESPSMRRIQGFAEFQQTGIELSPEESAGVVLNLLLELAGSEEILRRDDPGNVLVRLAQELIGAHLEEGINVSEVARRLRVSREHLTRIFTQTVHQTPHDYILRQRIRYACQLLKDTDATVKEVAARLGFRTSSHFARSFKTLTGHTPLSFRERGIIVVL